MKKMIMTMKLPMLSCPPHSRCHNPGWNRGKGQTKSEWRIVAVSCVMVWKRYAWQCVEGHLSDRRIRKKNFRCHRTTASPEWTPENGLPDTQEASI